MLTLSLEPEPTAARTARRFVRDCCVAAHSPDDLCDDAVLLASEVVTNAFTHGRSEARLGVDARPGRVHVEVSDDNSRHPQVQTDDRDALDGRGMRILDRLARRWGVRDDAFGKTVWFDLEVGDPPAGAHLRDV